MELLKWILCAENPRSDML